MKLNKNLEQDLMKKSINLDMKKFQEYMQEKPKDPGNFRVRPMTGQTNNSGQGNNEKGGKKEIDLMSTATSFFKNNNNQDEQINHMTQSQVKRPQTPTTVRKSTLNQSQIGFYKQQQQAQEEDEYEIENEDGLDLENEEDLEQYIIQTNHNNINEFNKDLPMLDTIEVETLETYLDTPQCLFFDLTSISLKFDANCDSLQLVGDLMPFLQEVKLNNSIIPCIRDIGTSLQNLKVLWINRVGLEDLSGINSLKSLKELYANYNSINDLMNLDFNETIEILDLEGNDIEDIQNLDYLETMDNLKDLNLSGNPINNTPGFRELVKQKMNKLQILNEKCMVMDIMQKSQIVQDDEQEIEENEKNISDFIKNMENNDKQQLYDIYSILKTKNKECIVTDEVIKKIEDLIKNDPDEELILLQSVKKTSKKVSQKKNLFQLNEQQQEKLLQSETSALTEGTDQVFTGNPLKALKNKRKENNNSDKQSEIPDELFKMIEIFKKNDMGALKELRKELNMEHDYSQTPCVRTSVKKSVKKEVTKKSNPFDIIQSPKKIGIFQDTCSKDGIKQIKNNNLFSTSQKQQQMNLSSQQNKIISKINTNTDTLSMTNTNLKYKPLPKKLNLARTISQDKPQSAIGNPAENRHQSKDQIFSKTLATGKPFLMKNMKSQEENGLNHSNVPFKYTEPLKLRKMPSQHQEGNNSTVLPSKQMADSSGFKKFDPSTIQKPAMFKRKILQSRGSTNGVNIENNNSNIGNMESSGSKPSGLQQGNGTRKLIQFKNVRPVMKIPQPQSQQSNQQKQQQE